MMVLLPKGINQFWLKSHSSQAWSVCMVVSGHLSLLVTAKKLDMSQSHLDSQGHRFTHMKNQTQSLGLGTYQIYQMRHSLTFQSQGPVPMQ